ELGVAALTLALLIGVPRVIRRIPAPLIALSIVAVVAVVLDRLVPGFEVATIGSRFRTMIGGEEVAGIPPLPPMPAWPWGHGGPGGPGGEVFHMSWGMVRELLPSALAIALLGAIESLLSAVIADSATGTRHDPNAEL